MPEPTPAEPHFRMDDDGRHLWYSHQCINVHPDFLESDGTIETMLPLGPGGWIVDSREPMTVRPSILCRSCQTHGFITDGKWVSV